MKKLYFIAFFLTSHICTKPVIEEENNAGKIVSTLLRDIFGAMVCLKASDGDTQVAAASLQKIFTGMANIVEMAVEENKTRCSDVQLDHLESIFAYLESLVTRSLEHHDEQQKLLFFLEELKAK